MECLFLRSDGSFWYENSNGNLMGFEAYSKDEIRLLEEINGRIHSKVVYYKNIPLETARYIKLICDMKESGLSVSYPNRDRIIFRDTKTNKTYQYQIPTPKKKEYTEKELKLANLKLTKEMYKGLIKETVKETLTNDKKRHALEVALLSTSACIIGYQVTDSIGNNEYTIEKNKINSYKEDLIKQAYNNLKELGILDRLQHGYYKADLMQYLNLQSDTNHLTIWAYYNALQKVDGLNRTTKESLKDQLFIYIQHNDGNDRYRDFNDYCINKGLVDENGKPSIDKFNEVAVQEMKFDIDFNLTAELRIPNINIDKVNNVKIRTYSNRTSRTM